MKFFSVVFGGSFAVFLVSARLKQACGTDARHHEVDFACTGAWHSRAIQKLSRNGSQMFEKM